MGKKRLQSPSSINTYLQCPRKYFYIYKWKLPGSPSIHLVRGVVAHSALEKLYDLLPEVISDSYKKNLRVIAIELLKKFWKESESEFAQLKMTSQQLDTYFEETKDMLLTHLDLINDRLEFQMSKGLSFVEAFKKIKPVCEKEYKSWDFYVRGFIDVIEDVDGKIRLMDYKTSKKAKISDAYKLQLAIYAMLYELEHGVKPAEVGIYFLKFPKDQGGEMVLPVDEELIKHGKFMVEQIHASTDSDNIADYPKNQTPLCKWSTGQCDYYDYCFKGKPLPPEPLKSQWQIKKEKEEAEKKAKEASAN